MDNSRCIGSEATSSDPRAVDRALVARLERGEVAALRELIDAYGGFVHATARGIVADPCVVEEIAQDVYLAIWDRPERFDSTRAGLRTYLSAMTRNKAIDRLRNFHARERATASLVESARADAEGPAGEHLIELRTSLIPLIEALPRSHREAIVLAFYGGRTYKQVAQELDIPEGTAKTRLRQGLKSMQRALEGEGLAVAVA